MSKTARQHDNYLNAIRDSLDTLPADGAALNALLVTFDDGLQNARIKASLSQYTGNRVTTAAQLALITDALSQL